MGFLSCLQMSEDFINHLLKRGPVSVRAAANRYWRRQSKGYCANDDDHKDNALMALIHVACCLAHDSLIVPTKRNTCWAAEWLRESTDITPEQWEYFVNHAPVEDFNRYLLEMNEEDTDGNYIWFEPIVWRLTDKALKHPELLQLIDGVEL